MPAKYSIRDLERLSGIKAHTLRIWEQRYEILNPERTQTNIRYYNNTDLKRLLNISLLNNNGYKISNIAKLTHDCLLQEVEKFLNTYVKECDQVESLVLALLDLDESRFETTVNNCIRHFGFENTVEKVLFPFLRHTGNMWQVGMISAAQEHYISNLIRQKLIAALDALVPIKNVQPKTHLFFLPNQELHELGLLYACYLTKAKGHTCVYLGQSVPFDDLVSICKTLAPQRLVTIFTAKIAGNNANAFLKACHHQLPGIELLISGRLLFHPDQPCELPSPRFKLFADFEGFKKLIEP